MRLPSALRLSMSDKGFTAPDQAAGFGANRHRRSNPEGRGAVLDCVTFGSQ
jgi:hypothetical protein